MSLRLARRLVSIASALIWMGATLVALARLPTPISGLLAVFLLGIALGTLSERARSVWRRVVRPS
jgi:hypothetical protein